MRAAEFSESLDDTEQRLSRLEQTVLNLVANDMERESLSEEVKELQKLQRETNERLDAVILTVEKFLENRNGK